MNIRLLAALLLTIGWLPCIKAQKKGVFTANGKVINIDSFEREVRQTMKDVGVPGISLAVIDNGRIVFHNGYGLRRIGSSKKVNDRTLFSACSLSKSFLVYVVYQLVDEGLLDLDKPLYLYLESRRLTYDPRSRRITARMVLSHSSGLENWQYLNNNELLEILSDPGTRFNYSGEGYQYLSRVVTKILHQSYEEYITERVIRPLDLKNTCLRYKKPKIRLFHDRTPSNYAVGHLAFGEQRWPDWFDPVPAAGNQVTAADYARLILSIFDSTHLSAARIHDIVSPIVRVDSTDLFYGPGFELFFDNDSKDTIVAHGGSNPGYKNLFFYSVKHRRGFVLMTNSDRGKSIVGKLCGMTAGLDLDRYFSSTYYYLREQYPSTALRLLKLYDDEGADAMLREVKALKHRRELNVNTLNVLSDFFASDNKDDIAEKLLTENVALYPDSSLAYVLLGGVYSDMDMAVPAVKCYRKAKELGFNLWDVSERIKRTALDSMEVRRRETFLTKIVPGQETTVEAENYNAMRGIEIQRSLDADSGRNIGSFDKGDWVDYQVDVAVEGTYTVTFRTASTWEHNQLLLISGDTTLKAVDLGPSAGWHKWRSQTTSIHLPAGKLMLRVTANIGEVELNWMKFSLSEDKISKK